MMNRYALVISCEHAVNTVPEDYAALFNPFAALLTTHRAIDIGALAIAQYLNETLPSELVHATTTRLLIDCNRSLHHYACFSEITKSLPFDEKKKIMHAYYTPFREQIIDAIKNHHAQGIAVLHLSIHSFTPVLNDIIRTTDIGFLYHPQRPLEKSFAKQWQKEIKQTAPQLRVRMNYPYKGISDGFNSALRKQFTPDTYLGLEIECNQALTGKDQTLNNLKNILSGSLLKLLC